jgi:hypothetical protein
MLVDCTRLRKGGVKLEHHELDPPVRGHLRIGRGTARLTYYPTSPTTVGDIVPPLSEVRIHRLDGDDLVLHGVEETVAAMIVLRQPQAWWCKAVRQGSA